TTTTAATTPTISMDEITLAKALIEIKISTPKAKGLESAKNDKAETIQESISKRAGDEFEQESSKKQKIKDENESTEVNRCLEIVPGDGDKATIDDTPLSSKSPTIVDYKIYKEGRKSFLQIFREQM
nr:hypothetical protein [Tanacetum cinerariifolium]